MELVATTALSGILGVQSFSGRCLFLFSRSGKAKAFGMMVVMLSLCSAWSSHAFVVVLVWQDWGFGEGESFSRLGGSQD